MMGGWLIDGWKMVDGRWGMDAGMMDDQNIIH